MEKTRKGILNLKNLFGQFFQPEKQETLAVNEWTRSHQELNDPRYSFLESRIASLEGGIDAIAVKSLRSARFKIIYNLLEKGDNVVTFNSWNLAFADKAIYKRIGVEIKISGDGQIETFRSLIDKNTKLIYLETINSRFINVPDFIKIISHAQLLKIPVVVDNTASVGGYLFNPIHLKANLVIESLEDYLPKSTRQKAVIIDGDNFDWFGGSFKKLSPERLKFHKAADGKEISSNADLAGFHLIDFLRKKSSNRHNGYPIPQDPFSLVRKLEEIPTKIQLRSDNAAQLARLLKKIPLVSSVNYTGLTNGSGYFQALSFFRKGFGHYLSFTVAVDANAARYFFEELQTHAAFKYRLTFEQGQNEAYLSAPAVEFEELKEHLEASVEKLREFLEYQHLQSKPWLELVDLD